MKFAPLVVCFVFAFSAPSIGQEDFQYREHVDALVQPYLTHDKVNAVSVGIIHDGKTWFLNYGKLSEAKPNQPDNNTLYEIGSITKVFTSLLLADAVESKKMKLDQTVGSLLPELSQENPEVADHITLQQLSQHMSGLPRMPNNIQPEDPNNPFLGYNRERLTKFLKTVKPAHKPGTHHEYSNLAAGLLGDLLSAEANVDYETLLRNQVLNPLKMEDTTLKLSSSQSPRLAPPHNAAMISDHTWEFDALAGAGAIRSTTADMVRFLQAQLDPPANEVGQAIELAWKKQLDAGDGHLAMGLGWMIAGDGSTRWHNGQTGGYHAMLLVNRKLNAGVVVLCNTAATEVDALAEGIFQTIVGMKVEPAKFAEEVDVDAKVVQRLTGKYQLAPSIEIEIFANGNKLMAQLTGQQALRIYPESDTIWNYRLVEAQLRFELPAEGNATKVTLFQNGREMPAPRK